MPAVWPARVDVPWDEVDGRIYVALPKRRGRIERALARFMPVPANVLLTLEGGAARFWLLADGTCELADLAVRIRTDDEAEDVEARTRAFGDAMAARGLVRMLSAPEPVTDARRGLGEAQGFLRATCRRCKVVLPLRGRRGTFFLCPRCRWPNRAR